VNARPGSEPWAGLPHIDETAPPGVQLTRRVRPRHLHRGDYRGLPWLDPDLDCDMRPGP
jgi:hypothetical protein